MIEAEVLQIHSRPPSAPTTLAELHLLKAQAEELKKGLAVLKSAMPILLLAAFLALSGLSGPAFAGTADSIIENKKANSQPKTNPPPPPKLDPDAKVSLPNLTCRSRICRNGFIQRCHRRGGGTRSCTCRRTGQRCYR